MQTLDPATCRSICGAALLSIGHIEALYGLTMLIPSAATLFYGSRDRVLTAQSMIGVGLGTVFFIDGMMRTMVDQEAREEAVL